MEKKQKKSEVGSPKSEAESQSEVLNENFPAMNHEPSAMNYRLWTMFYGLILFLLFSQNAFSQFTISYGTNPAVFNVGTAITPLTATVTGGTPAINGQTLTIAGNGAAGYVDGQGVGVTSFNYPSGGVADAVGNLYIADAQNHVIRKIIIATGVVTTFAGSGASGSADGTLRTASFNFPYGLCLDASGNMYVADARNNNIRKITPGGVVTTLAGTAGTSGSTNGAGSAASFNSPFGVAADASGNLYVADYSNNMIRKIIISTTVVSTFAGTGVAGAGNGAAGSATFNGPEGIAVDASGNIYVADQLNSLIRKITTGASPVVSTYASGFNKPEGVAADASGIVYVTNTLNNMIDAISTSGFLTTLSGQITAGSIDGPGAVAEFYRPCAVAADNFGNVYVCDRPNNIIRKVSTTAFSISPYLPSGLSFNGVNGTISGTPAEAMAATMFTVTAYSGISSTSTTITLTVNGTPVAGPTSNQNYVVTNAPRIAGIVNDSTLMAVTGNTTALQTSIQYVDGLGRPVQTVQEGASPLGYDMVAPQAYDQYGREITKYLPYTPQTGLAGNWRPNAVSTDQNAFYTTPPTGSGVTAITDPVAQTNFDNSPLNRPVEEGAPGVPWQLSTSGITGSGHTVKMVYTLNNATSFATDSINGRQAAMYYTIINSDNGQSLHANGYYPANTLTVTISKDENWTGGRAGTVEEYKDIDGHVVLKRAYNYNSSHVVEQLSTYYIYDDLNRLAFVLPPMSGADGAGTIAQATLDNLCYQYQYDERGRPVQKKIPGKGWEYTVFNTMDQPVATQDANQLTNKQWIYTKYDALGRSVITGIWTNGGTAITRLNLQTTLDGISSNFFEASQTTGTGYTNVAWPTSSTTPLTYNYYDSYANAPGLPAAYSAPTGANLATRSELTATLTAVLNTPTNMLWTAHYYDNWGRSLKSYAQHYLGGTLSNNNYDAINSTYNFTNAPTTTTRQHWNTASTLNPLVTIANTYIYDQVGRKLKTWEQITNVTTSTTKTLISNSVYNEIGQVGNKKLRATVTDSLTFLQNIAYTYNERGWLNTSTAPLFQMQLYYNTAVGSKLYNGNIVAQYWGQSGSYTNHFNYAYDKLNRLLGGATSTDGYGDEGIVYDLMGNMKHLYRFMATVEVDQLTYNYLLSGNPTNQVQSIVDAGTNAGLVAGTTTYTYDPNGNTLSNTNTVNTGQNKSYTYNLLNLPLVVTVPTGTVTYTYDATGNKLRKVDVLGGTTTTTDYINGIEYDNSTSTIGFIQTEEGKAVPNGTGYDYVYYLGDNLGNTRVTFGTKTGAAVVYQQDDYYPFGLEINRSILSPKNEYLYNRKELQEETSVYDYGLRQYDPLSARWLQIDPMAEISRRWSPYNYVENNPIRFIDPDGMYETEAQINETEQRQAEEQLGFQAGRSASNFNGASVGNGGGDPPPKKGKSTSQTESTVKKVVDVLPVLGKADQAGDELKNGEYGNATLDEGSAILEMFMFVPGKAVDGVVSLEDYVAGFFAKKGAFEELSVATKYGFGTYKDLAQLTAGKGLNVHHLIEQRFASLFGEKESDMISIVLTESEHQAFTKAWRSQIGYEGSTKAAVTTLNATKSEVEAAAREVYKNYPQILKKLGL